MVYTLIVEIRLYENKYLLPKQNENQNLKQIYIMLITIIYDQ